MHWYLTGYMKCCTGAGKCSGQQHACKRSHWETMIDSDTLPHKNWYVPDSYRAIEKRWQQGCTNLNVVLLFEFYFLYSIESCVKLEKF